jgi:hypothetical protein
LIAEPGNNLAVLGQGGGWLVGPPRGPGVGRPGPRSPHPRGAGTAVQSAALWGTNLLITLTLLSLISGMGRFSPADFRRTVRS